MISIYSIPFSRTGNHIIQYLFGVVLSEYKNYNLYTKPIKGFSKIVNIEKKINNNNNLTYCGNSQQYTDVDRLKNHDGGIVIDGFLQRYQYFKNDIENLKQYIIPDEKTDIIPGKNDLVMHIRLTDYLSGNFNVPFHVYDEFIKNKKTEFDKIILVTDDPQNEFIEKLLLNEKTTLIHQNMYKDFDLLRVSKNIFISQSSYSWLAAYFGEADNIYVPLRDGDGKFLWKLNPNITDINLVDKQDKRFNIIVLNNFILFN